MNRAEQVFVEYDVNSGILVVQGCFVCPETILLLHEFKDHFLIFSEEFHWNFWWFFLESVDYSRLYGTLQDMNPTNPWAYRGCAGLSSGVFCSISSFIVLEYSTQKSFTSLARLFQVFSSLGYHDLDYFLEFFLCVFDIGRQVGYRLLYVNYIVYSILLLW